MKIISVISSFRKNGNTKRVIKFIEEAIGLTAEKENVPVEIETVFLGHTDIQLCRGCRICFDKGEEMCPLKDELLQIRDKIRQADGIILASPVYVEDINGIMKNWIDRMAFNCHRPAFGGKPAIIVTTSGIGSSGHAIKTMNFAFLSWGGHIVGRGNFRMGGIMEIKEIKSRYDSQIKSIADKLLYSITEKKSRAPSFYSLIAFKVQQKYWQKTIQERGTVDYLYWENNGWLEKYCEYYMKIGTNRFKVKLARLIGGIVSRFYI